MKKRFISLFVAIVFLCGLMPMGIANVYAFGETDIAYPVEGGNIYFDRETGTITDCDQRTYKADIPEKIDDKPVVAIGEGAFEYCGFLESVTIPDSVTDIGTSAFSCCSELINVTIPPSVTSIGSYAFYECSSLTSITIPASVTSIGNGVFSWCSGLTDICVENGNPKYCNDEDGVLFDKAKTELIKAPRVVTGEYIIPNSVTRICEWAFSHCCGLTSVTIPSTVTSIDDGAFYNCSNLDSLTIPDCVTSIANYVFDGCSNLKDVMIPNGVTSIGEAAFRNCSNLTNMTIPAGVKNISAYAFEECSGLTSVTISNGVTSIGEGAFNRCTSLVSVVIPSSVTEIEGEAFTCCSSLNGFFVESDNLAYCNDENGVLFNKDKSILIQGPGAITGGYAIPNGVTSINRSAFGYCNSLTGVTIPDSVMSVGGKSFEGCTSLTSVSISNGLTTIGWEAFKDCTSLTNVTIPDSVTEIEWGPFEGCSSLISIDVSEGNPEYSSENGILFRKDKTALVVFPASKPDTEYRIPDSVKRVESCAFSNCSSLTTVMIPDSVTDIGSDSFQGCTSLTAINVAEENPEYASENGVLFKKDKTLLIVYPASKPDKEYSIPDSVTEICDDAFVHCSNLTSVTIPASVERIYGRAFEDCSRLRGIFVDSENQTYCNDEDGVLFCKNKTKLIRAPEAIAGEYTIPDCVKRIREGAFGHCSRLTGVTIPDSVAVIESQAFEGCSRLRAVRFLGVAPKMEGQVFQIRNGDEMEYSNIPDLTLYYVGEKPGWTSPEWNGYPIAIWNPEEQPLTESTDISMNEWLAVVAKNAAQSYLMNVLGNVQYGLKGDVHRILVAAILMRFVENIFKD